MLNDFGRSIFLAAVLLGASGRLVADPADAAPSAQATVEPSVAHLGDLLTLRITVVHHAAFAVQPPVFPKSLGTFEVRASTPLPAQVQGSQITDHFIAQLQNFSTGPQLLPGIEILYRDLDNQTHTLKTPEVIVTINEVPAGPHDKGDIRGIKGVIGPVSWSPWWWALAVLALVGAGVLAWRQRVRHIQGPPPAPPIPADEDALRKLQNLLAAGWIESGRLKEFYSALSDISRAYIENRFRVPALERTTGELMRDLRKRNPIDTAHQQRLKELLEACDLVKFAKFRPEADEALAGHAEAVKIVEETRAVPEGS